MFLRSCGDPNNIGCSSNWKKVKLLGRGAHGSVFLAAMNDDKNIFNNCKDRYKMSKSELHVTKFHNISKGDRSCVIFSNENNQERVCSNIKDPRHIAVKQVVLDSYQNKKFKLVNKKTSEAGKDFGRMSSKSTEDIDVENLHALLKGKLCERDETSLKSIIHEINIISQLDHPNVVQYIGTHCCGNCINLLVEYCEGGSLRQLVQREGAMREDLVRKHILQILEGVKYLHCRGIVHRDIKGANILLNSDGTCKIADFGVSKQVNKKHTMKNESRDCSHTSPHSGLTGTPHWMAPEVIKGLHNIPERHSVTEETDNQKNYNDEIVYNKVKPQDRRNRSISDLTKGIYNDILVKSEKVATSESLIEDKKKATSFHEKGEVLKVERKMNDKDVESFWKKADVWSIGCVVVELITGEMPWPQLNPFAAMWNIANGETPPLDRHKLSIELQHFLHRCFAIDANERATIAELLDHPFIQGYRLSSYEVNKMVTKDRLDILDVHQRALNHTSIDLIKRNENSNNHLDNQRLSDSTSYDEQTEDKFLRAWNCLNAQESANTFIGRDSTFSDDSHISRHISFIEEESEYEEYLENLNNLKFHQTDNNDYKCTPIMTEKILEYDEIEPVVNTSLKSNFDKNSPHDDIQETYFDTFQRFPNTSRFCRNYTGELQSNVALSKLNIYKDEKQMTENESYYRNSGYSVHEDSSANLSNKNTLQHPLCHNEYHSHASPLNPSLQHTSCYTPYISNVSNNAINSSANTVVSPLSLSRKAPYARESDNSICSPFLSHVEVGDHYIDDYDVEDINAINSLNKLHNTKLIEFHHLDKHEAHQSEDCSSQQQTVYEKTNSESCIFNYSHLGAQKNVNTIQPSGTSSAYNSFSIQANENRFDHCVNYTNYNDNISSIRISNGRKNVDRRPLRVYRKRNLRQTNNEKLRQRGSSRKCQVYHYNAYDFYKESLLYEPEISMNVLTAPLSLSTSNDSSHILDSSKTKNRNYDEILGTSTSSYQTQQYGDLSEANKNQLHTPLSLTDSTFDNSPDMTQFSSVSMATSFKRSPLGYCSMQPDHTNMNSTLSELNYTAPNHFLVQNDTVTPPSFFKQIQGSACIVPNTSHYPEKVNYRNRLHSEVQRKSSF